MGKLSPTDWYTELPFLHWSEDKTGVVLGQCADGSLGYQTIDGGAVRFDDPRVQAYTEWRKQTELNELTSLFRESWDAITNLDNDEPFLRSFLRRHPDTVLWIIGEKADHRPTIAESHLKAAYVDRLRRLKERRVETAGTIGDDDQDETPSYSFQTTAKIKDGALVVETSDPPEVPITSRDLARELGMDEPDTLTRWINKGVLSFVEAGGKRKPYRLMRSIAISELRSAINDGKILRSNFTPSVLVDVIGLSN